MGRSTTWGGAGRPSPPSRQGSSGRLLLSRPHRAQQPPAHRPSHLDPNRRHRCTCRVRPQKKGLVGALPLIVPRARPPSPRPATFRRATAQLSSHDPRGRRPLRQLCGQSGCRSQRRHAQPFPADCAPAPGFAMCGHVRLSSLGAGGRPGSRVWFCSPSPSSMPPVRSRPFPPPPCRPQDPTAWSPSRLPCPRAGLSPRRTADGL